MPGNFAIRLRCPLCEADSWVTLADRQETYEQIQQQTWEFKCREHGPQTGTPKEVMGVAPLDDPPPCTQQSALAFANPISTEKTKRIPRSSERLPLRIPVVVYGFTKNCGAFHEETETQTVNASGALVVLKTKLALGDSVFLVQRGNGLEQEVRVVYLDSYTDRETKEVSRCLDRPRRKYRSQSSWRGRPAKRERHLARGTPRGRARRRTRQGQSSQEVACRLPFAVCRSSFHFHFSFLSFLFCSIQLAVPSFQS